VWACLLMPESVFAVEDPISVQETAELFGEFLDFLSWLWIIPAIVAGKFMTNEFVYGDVFWLTEVLRQLWQAMRTFSYFTLWFVFIAMILSHFFKQDDPAKLGDTIKKTFIAWILIQMSWFLMAALVDLSVVMTAAVWAIPLQVMEPQWNQLQNQFKVKKIVINADNGKIVNEAASATGWAILTLDDVMPDYDTVGWSLVFLAAWVMRLSEIHFVWDTNADQNAENINYEWIIIASAIKLIVVLMFVVPMLVLMIVNAIRIFWIWVWILFSPFIVLDVVFNGPLQKSEQGDKFKISTIFGLVFQPVVIVWLLALWLIMIVWVLDALVGWEDYERESLSSMQVYIEWESATRVWNGPNAEAIITWDLIKDVGGHVWWFVGQTLISVFAIFLLWALVKAWASFSAVTKDFADKSFAFAESSMKSIPLPWIGSIAAWAKALQDVKSTSRILEQQHEEQASKALEGVYQTFWLNEKAAEWGMKPDEKTSLIQTLSRGGNSHIKTRDFWNKMHEYASDKDKWEWLTYRGSTQEVIQKWFEEAGRDYLKLDKDATIASSWKARAFIDRMMKEWWNTASTYQDTNRTTGWYTHETERHKGWRSN